MTPKARLSVTVDADVVEEGRAAVAAGRSESLSAWVNDALKAHSEHHRRLQAMDDFLAEYQDEHGPITDEEIEAATQRARARATVIRSGKRTSARRAG